MEQFFVSWYHEKTAAIGIQVSGKLPRKFRLTGIPTSLREASQKIPFNWNSNFQGKLPGKRFPWESQGSLNSSLREAAPQRKRNPVSGTNPCAIFYYIYSLTLKSSSETQWQTSSLTRLILPKPPVLQVARHSRCEPTVAVLPTFRAAGVISSDRSTFFEEKNYYSTKEKLVSY